MSWSRNSLSRDSFAVEIDERKIDSVFAALEQCHLPGAAVGIAIGGKSVYRKGFGLANMELPIALTPTTRMRIGSITKQFTCLAYMLLCEEGMAAIDDPIGTYLPELHPSARQVTLRQLMGNISGLHCACTLKFLFSGLGGQAVTSTELISLYRDIEDVNAAPGTRWIYNNGGFVLLSSVIERIAERPLEDVLRERIFEPVGMYDTRLRRWDTDFVPNSAIPHMMDKTGKFERAYWGLDFAGGGAMVSTVNDMLRWLSHMDAPRVGNATTWALMKTPQVLANGVSTGYGLGLRIDHYRGAETLGHAGGWLGGNAQLLKVPAAGFDVAIMVNREDVSAVELVANVLDACLPDLKPIQEFTPRPIASGVFRSPVSGRIIQLFPKNGQQFVSIGGIDMPVEPDHEGVLRPTGALAYMKQSVALVGDPVQPQSIRFSDFGIVDDMVPVQPAGDTGVSAIEGRYRSDTIDVDVTICDTRDGPQMNSVGRFGSADYRLECLADGIWRARSHPAYLGGILAFDADGAEFRFAFGPNTVSPLPFRKV